MAARSAAAVDGAMRAGHGFWSLLNMGRSVAGYFAGLASWMDDGERQGRRLHLEDAIPSVRAAKDLIACLSER